MKTFLHNKRVIYLSILIVLILASASYLAIKDRHKVVAVKKPTPVVIKPTSEAQQLANWWSQNSDIQANLAGDVSGIISEVYVISNKSNFNNWTAANPSYGVMSSDCQNLASEASRGLALPAVPNATIQSNFKSALGEYQQGAQYCITSAKDYIDGSDIHSATLVDQSIGEENTALADIQSANGQMTVVADSFTQ